MAVESSEKPRKNVGDRSFVFGTHFILIEWQTVFNKNNAYNSTLALIVKYYLPISQNKTCILNTVDRSPKFAGGATLSKQPTSITVHCDGDVVSSEHLYISAELE